jgi:hypothetical protein
MPRGSAAQTVFPFGDQPEELPRGQEQDLAVGWDHLLRTSFADPDRHSAFLPQAEEAVRAQPGDGHILLLAATAALLDQHPARAQVFLKRFSKRYVAIGTCHLLRALALAQENKLGLARSVDSTPCAFFREALGVGHGSLNSTTGFSNETKLAGVSALPPKSRAKARARSGRGRGRRGARASWFPQRKRRLRRPHCLRCR